MKIIKLNQLEIFNQQDIPLSCAIGFFDGVHLGHQEIINNLKEKPMALITFEQTNNYLTSAELKNQLLKPFGFEYLIILANNSKIMESSKEEFIEFLNRNKIKSLVCGHDFRFGFQRLGSIKDLTQFNLKVLDDQKNNNQRISSTLIKEFLKDGHVDIIPDYLGRYYQIEGPVMEGLKLGRTIGFPTINIDYQGYFLPMSGVYQVKCKINNQSYNGMANLGFNPTVGNNQKQKLEIHLFDFNQDVYGETVKIEFLKFIREEKKFNSLDELKKAIEKDKTKIKDNFWRSYD